LRTFFGCLAGALDYLHLQNIRHNNINHRTILVDRGNILFTDFSLSFNFSYALGSTTTRMEHAINPRYCAPEVAHCEPQNTSSDIWSLGVIFTEMIVVLKGKTVQFMEEFFCQHGNQ
ncbi:kinase-like protein, partial [Byssothecium circinans]